MHPVSAEAWIIQQMNTHVKEIVYGGKVQTLTLISTDVQQWIREAWTAGYERGKEVAEAEHSNNLTNACDNLAEQLNLFTAQLSLFNDYSQQQEQGS